jgi:hypothetical protein
VLTLRLALALHPLERVRRAGLRRFLSRPQPSSSAHAARAVQPPRAPLAAAVVVWRQHALPRAATGSGCPRPHGPPTPSRPAPAAAATATEARAGCVSRVLACTNDDQWHRACGAPPTCPCSRVQPQTRQEAADETISLVGGLVTSSPPAVHDVHSGIYNCNLGQRMLRAALSLPITRIHDSVSLSYTVYSATPPRQQTLDSLSPRRDARLPLLLLQHAGEPWCREPHADRLLQAGRTAQSGASSPCACPPSTRYM